jgi:hypothetical protein
MVLGVEGGVIMPAEFLLVLDRWFSIVFDGF